MEKVKKKPVRLFTDFPRRFLAIISMTLNTELGIRATVGSEGQTPFIYTEFGKITYFSTSDHFRLYRPDSDTEVEHITIKGTPEDLLKLMVYLKKGGECSESKKYVRKVRQGGSESV